jgi:hypothetical protein
MNARRPVLAVAVVSYNTRAALRRCLASLRRDRSGLELHTCVVDNASRDASPDMVRHEFPEVRLLALSGNIGFGRAMNLALAGLAADYVMWLNPDAELAPDAVQEMLAVLARHPRAGLVAPRLSNVDGTLQRSLRRRSFYRTSHLFLGASGLERLLPVVRRRLDRDRYGDWNHDGEASVEFANGACFFLPGEVCRAIGPLDERFVIYSEDVDYCERVRRAGYEIRYAPAARVLHLGGASTKQAPILLRTHLIHSKWLFLAKHFGAGRALSYRACVAAEAVRHAAAALQRRSRHRARLAATLFGWAVRPRVAPLPDAVAGIDVALGLADLAAEADAGAPARRRTGGAR